MAKLDFNADEEEAVEDILKKAIEVLNEADRSLPAMDLLLPLLKRGTGVHHSDLLPILKKAFELTFHESFAMGLKKICVYKRSEMGWTEPPMEVIWRMYSDEWMSRTTRKGFTRNIHNDDR